MLAAALAAASLLAPGWARTDLKPVTQPEVVGDRIVLLVAGHQGLHVVGLDAAGGRTVWSHPATTSDLTPGEAPDLAINGTDVIYLAKESGDVARLTAV